jgi:hypothetical protein
MKPARITTFLALLLTAVVASRAAAGTLRTVTATAFHATAHAAHTDASARESRAPHLARHRPRHRGAHMSHAVLTSTRLGRPRPAPAPVRSHPEHRAVPPGSHSTLRDHDGSRYSGRMVATLPGVASLVTVATISFAPVQNESFACLESAVLGGRGPPRAGPSTHLKPRFAGGRPTFLASPTLRSGFSDRFHAAASHGPYGAPAFLERQQPLPGCARTRRPEGAAVCC